MKNGIRIADLRRLEREVLDGEISYSKMVETLNSIAQSPLKQELERVKGCLKDLSDEIEEGRIVVYTNGEIEPNSLISDEHSEIFNQAYELTKTKDRDWETPLHPFEFLL